MFIIANLLNAVAMIIHYVLQIYLWLVIGRAIISWVNPDPYNPIVNFLSGHRAGSVSDQALASVSQYRH